MIVFEPINVKIMHFCRSFQKLSVFLIMILRTFSLFGFPLAIYSGVGSLAQSIMHFAGVMSCLCSFLNRQMAQVAAILMFLLRNYSRNNILVSKGNFILYFYLLYQMETRISSLSTFGEAAFILYLLIYIVYRDYIKKTVFHRAQRIIKNMKIHVIVSTFEPKRIALTRLNFYLSAINFNLFCQFCRQSGSLAV